MDGIGTEERRYRQGSYGGLPTPDARQTTLQVGTISHGPPPPSSGPPNSWHSHQAPPPSSGPIYDRPPSTQSQPPPPPQSYGQYPPRPDYIPPATATPYPNSDCLSTPRRSPADVPNAIHTPVNGHNPDGPPTDHYVHRPVYPPMEQSPNGKYPPPPPSGMQNREPMANPPSGPPPAPQYPASQPPPPVAYPSHPPPHHSVPVGPPPPGAYYGHPPPTVAQAPYARPRGHRAQHACDSCRSRKSKCDEAKPRCSHCQDNDLVCNYRELQNPKQEKSGQGQLESFLAKSQQNHQDVMSKLHQLVDTMHDHGNRLRDLEDVVKTLSSGTEANSPTQGYSKEQIKRSVSGSAEPTYAKAVTDHQPPAGDSSYALPSALRPRSPTEPLVTPTGHTTSAHELLFWPSIRFLLKDKPPPEDYVMKGEWSRGLLRLFGYGEGQNKDDTAQTAASPPNSVYSDDHNAGSPDVDWGFDLDSARDGAPITDDHPGGLGPDGRLRLDHDTIDTYVKSYLRHMYILHPILDPNKLDTMIQKFKDLYSPQLRNGHLGKRKRENDSKSYHPERFDAPAAGPRHPKVARTIGNAMIVLVIALGKICAHRERLPGPAKPSRSGGATSSTPNSQHNSLRSSSVVSSIHNSPSIAQANQPQSHAPSPNESSWNARNMDVVPGLAYFAWTVGVLGDHLGGSDLEHCQAFLLAALYWGQLAHPYSSYAWIQQAAAAVLGLISRSRDLLEATKRDPGGTITTSKVQVGLIVTCYWTCLQLESDIRAELKEMQPSMIISNEGYMEENNFYPESHAIRPVDEYDQETITQYYFFQLHLRKLLNHIQSVCFNPNKPFPEHKRIPFVMEQLDHLEAVRQTFGNAAWRDGEDPAGEILAARLRAKFYGARNILFRQILEGIIKEEFEIVERTSQVYVISPAATSGSGPHSPAVTHAKNSQHNARQRYERRFPAHHAFSQSLNDTDVPPLDGTRLRLAKLGIQSLVESTIAFDKVQDARNRLIVTNIFGTLHAQFGNMLVLAAAYQSRRLSQFLEWGQLEILFARTKVILEAHAAISPTLKKDAEILSHIQNNLSSINPKVESFSSHGS